MKVKDNLDLVLNSVFTNEEKAILEYTIQTTPPKKMTVQDQFLYFYNKACYDGTQEELINAMIIKKQDHCYLLHQLQDMSLNLLKITDINEYNKVTREYTDTLASEGGIRATATKTQNRNQTTDQIIGKDRSNQSSLDLNESGVSQTNKLYAVETVIKRPDVSTGEAGNQYTPKEESKPTHYQNYSIDQTLNNNFNNSDSTTNQTTDSTGTSDTLSNTTDTRASKTDASKISVEYLTNDNRVKMWRLEIPKLRRKFWQIFHNIFTYEQW